MSWRIIPALLLLLLGLTLSPLPLAYTAPAQPTSGGYSLRFNANDDFEFDRVKIRIDSPASPADIGATDFTIEFWIKAAAADNPNSAQCGNPIGWTTSHIIFDRDRFNQNRKFGLGVFGNGQVIFGIQGADNVDFTLCSSGVNVLDNQWHHLAVQRRLSDGYLWLFVDGVLRAQADGPNGDVSYPDGATPGNFCNATSGGSGSDPCTYSDPFLVFGAEKHGFPGVNYNGLLDEVRLSTVLRYPTTGSGFTTPTIPFTPDASTAALYHFDEGSGATTDNATGVASANGTLRVGGNPSGPLWSPDTPFPAAPVDCTTAVACLYLPLVRR